MLNHKWIDKYHQIRGVCSIQIDYEHILKQNKSKYMISQILTKYTERSGDGAVRLTANRRRNPIGYTENLLPSVTLSFTQIFH